MNNLLLPKKVTAIFILALTLFSIFPYILIRNIELGELEASFIFSWSLLNVFVFIMCLKIASRKAIAIHEDNLRRKHFPTTKELNEDVGRIIKSEK